MTPVHVSTNPHSAHSVSPVMLIKNFWRNKQIISQMTRREVAGRYKGSALGLLWSLFNPILMLVVYTFVFSEIFKARWGGTGGDDSKTQFAVVLFVGIIVLNLFCDVINRAPTLIIANANFVKKVIFPVEILSLVTVLAALFNSLINLGVLLVALLVFNGYVPWTAVFIPFVILPLVTLIMGLSWFLASLGVFIRDVGQTVTIVTTVLMFLSPVFYPLDAVPERFRPLILLNPLTFIIEQSRAVLIWGELPDWKGLLMYCTASVIIAYIGYIWFQKTRKGFADVL
ncbi:ABC transporter permease [Pseudomonas fluorescens]|uniref:Transport permease protein n=1 Tax=Pseudomonas fluorescens TaxID=294 RepID=A0A5E7RLG5_PSEFL|nr:ABC transporter permease [Pseudomonas fluorescens]VVP74814.1 Teichoic acid translocation permease protein TagG [Pseudomonas fluorescens]